MSRAVDPPARPRRRWLRLSVRTLMILVLVGGGGVGWWVGRIRPRRQAAARIEFAGGYVKPGWFYRYAPAPDSTPARGPDEIAPPPLAPPWFAWIRGWVGDDLITPPSLAGIARFTPATIDLFARIDTLEKVALWGEGQASGHLGALRRLPALQAVAIAGAVLAREDCAELATLPRLRSLTLGSMPDLADADLAPLAAATGLEAVAFSRCPRLTDAGMAGLVARWPRLDDFTWESVVGPIPLTLRALAEHHPGLRRLNLTEIGPIADADLAPFARTSGLTSVQLVGYGRGGPTDAGLAHLAGHRKLAVLVVPNLDARGDGLRALGGLPLLRHLALPRSRFDDRALATFPSLPALRELDLEETRLADADLPHLLRAPRLEALNLSRNPLTAAGLAHLAPLRSSLRRLNLKQTLITAEAVAASREGAPPTLHVEHREAAPDLFEHLASRRGAKRRSAPPKPGNNP